MSTNSDVLFDLYALTQDLMKHQSDIDTILSAIDTEEGNDEDFNAIENASLMIIDACEKIESRLAPQSCHCCCQT